MKIDDFEGSHTNESAFFIGNGPSLARTPLDNLSSEVTFATNKIHKIFPETDWRPTYYTYIHSEGYFDQNVVEECVSEARSAFVSSHFEQHLPDENNVCYLNTKVRKDDRIACLLDPNVPDEAKCCWSDNLRNQICLYNNSIYPVFQLVHHMGFDKLYLLGCDLGIDTDWYPIFENALEPKEFIHLYSNRYDPGLSRRIGYLREANAKGKALVNALAYEIPTVFDYFYNDESHFTSDYFNGVTITRGTDAAQRRAHQLGRFKLEERGIEVINLTPGGELDIHPREDLHDVLE